MMYKNYRIISTTPAGRKPNLKLLSKHLLKFSDIIDEHHFWVNTKVFDDIKYIYELTENPFFKAIEPEMEPDWIYSIHHFFQYCIDPGTIYLRFDDDICYIAPDAIKNLLDFRIEHPEFFLVFPVIVNNKMNTILDSPIKNIKGDWYYDCGHIINKHKKTLNLIKNGQVDSLKTSNYIVPLPLENDLARFNINSICWFGEEFRQFEGKVQSPEEHWLANYAPKKLNKNCAVCGSAVVVHYSFHTQRECLNGTNFLQEYMDLTQKSIKLQ